MLEILHPDWAHLSCETCRAHEIDWDTKRVATYPGTEKPLPRHENSKTLCETAKGCPVGHYNDQRRLSDKNEAAYRHYLECKALGRFPQDGIVERNAGIIYRAEQTADRVARWNLRKTTEQMYVALMRAQHGNTARPPG